LFKAGIRVLFNFICKEEVYNVKDILSERGKVDRYWRSFGLRCSFFNRLIHVMAESNLAEGMAVILLRVLGAAYVATSATNWSLVQRSPNGSVCVCV